MKKIFLVCVCLLLLLFVKISYSNINNEVNQNIKSEKKKNNIEKIIKNIRKQYININAENDSYTVKEINIYDESAEGSELAGCYYKGELKKIIGWYYGETGKALYEYYFSDNNFFFVYSKQFNYTPPIEEPYLWDSNKIASTEENRWYFDNQQLIRWIHGKEIISETNEEFLEYNKFFIKQFKKYNDIFIKNEVEQYGAIWKNDKNNK